MRVERVRRALRAVRDYVRYDLREIVAPSSLPDPPGVKHTSLTLVQYWQAAKRATQEYRKTWRREKRTEPEEAGTGESGQQPSTDAPISEDLAAAARGGTEAFKPLLAQLYQTRAAAYRDSLRAFVEGYREGLAAPAGSWEGILGPGPQGADTGDTPGEHTVGAPQCANTPGERESGASAGSGTQHVGAASGAGAPAGRGDHAQGASSGALHGAMAAAPDGTAAGARAAGSDALHGAAADAAVAAAPAARVSPEQGGAAGGSAALSRAPAGAGTPGAAAGGRRAAPRAGRSDEGTVRRSIEDASAAAGGDYAGGKGTCSSPSAAGRAGDGRAGG